MAAPDASDVGLEDLQQRLVTFTDQLESIHEMLQADTENLELLQIAQDLVEVIRLTKEAIDLKLGATQAPADDTSRHSETAPEAAVHAAQATATSLQEPDLAFAPGTMCEARSKGVFYPALIESITTRNTYNVHYLGFGNKDELAASELRAIEIPGSAIGLPDRAAIQVGFACDVKYYVDGQMYPAAVTAVTPHGFQVLFEGYGNSEEVPYEYLRPRSDSNAAAASSDATAPAPVNAAASASTPAAAVGSAEPADNGITKLIKVPENLQILPTDTEAEKHRKRKRVKQIQKLNRIAEVENERKIKQHNWKSFQNTALKKKVRGTGVLARHGTSIFASPDTVQGRVGVVGSGQGMTAFEDARKKVKRTHLESAPPTL